MSEGVENQVSLFISSSHQLTSSSWIYRSLWGVIFTYDHHEKSIQMNNLEVDLQVTLCMKPKISKNSMVYLLSTKVQRYSSREKSLFKKWCCKKKDRNAAIKTGYLYAKKDDSRFLTHTILKKKTESGPETETSKRKHRRKSWIREDRWDANEMHNSLRKKWWTGLLQY